jgi:hypothetical protein
MSKKVLLVTGDGSLLSELVSALGAREEDLEVRPCADHSRARDLLADFRPDFVIVSLALAQDSKSPVADFGGLAFCKAAIPVSAAPIAIITPSPLTVTVSDAVRTVGGNVTPYPVGEGYIAKVLNQIRTTRPPPKRLEILIEAHPDNRWTYSLRGDNFQYKRGGTLGFDLGAQTMSKALAEHIGSVPPDWEVQFETLGRGIVLSLFGVDSSFTEDVKQGVNEAGGLHHTRVIFAVGKEQYEIALEAVFPPFRTPCHPWMIHAPVLRNIRGQSASNTPLFDGPPRLRRCLIVGANTSGFCDDIVVGGRSLELGTLSHIKSECDAVEALFKDAKDALGFDDPKVVGTDPTKPLGKNDFQSLLQDEQWDVIHFAGHAYHSPTADREDASPGPQHACLFVGAPDHPEAVEMNTIAPSLRETTSLLYLSGCKTANAGFAVAAAQYGVPAVLGFRWKVQDKPAEQHARLFYHQLFREKAIDKAFRNTRRGMRLLNRKDNAWASGMLVMAS